MMGAAFFDLENWGQSPIFSLGVVASEMEQSRKNEKYFFSQ